MARRQQADPTLDPEEAQPLGPVDVEPAQADVVPPVPTSPVAASAEPDIKLSAVQYAQARGYRWQRCAGFLHEMRSKFPGSKTRPEWDTLWSDFHGRSVG